MSNIMLSLVKIEAMSSLEIAELLGCRHDSVKRSLDRLVQSGTIGLPPLVETNNNQGVRVKSYLIPKRDTYIVVAQMSPAFTGRLVDRWQYLEEQLRIVQLRTGTKKHQLDAMEALSRLLPNDLSTEELSYIKANTVVNKAVSNLFGFPKMLKKDEMSNDMLEVREKVLDDYIKLYEVLEDNGKVKELLYGKYQPKRIEDASVPASLKLVAK